MNLLYSIFCGDVDAQVEFYQALFGWPERIEDRSPIYRSLGLPHSQLGFHAHDAYEFLELGDRAPPPGRPPTTAYATLVLDTTEAVDDVATRAAHLGGRVIKPPYATYYGHWQTVLADPEENVFRASCASLPSGVVAPTVEWQKVRDEVEGGK